MTGARITVQDEDVVGALAKLIAAAGDTKGALQNVGEQLQKSTMERIRAGVTPTGAPFAPLNPLYRRFEKKGPGILRERGDLLNSIAYQLGGDGMSVEVGTDIVYGAIHQFGGTIVPKTVDALVFMLGGEQMQVASVTIPARPYLGISDGDRSEVLAIFEDFFQEATGGAATD